MYYDEWDEWIEDDIMIDGRGDIAIIGEKENIDLAVRRRLNTPKGDLFYDPSYGNHLFDRLSEPITESWLEEAIDDIRECLSGEQRIAVESIQYQIYPEKRSVKFTILYAYVNTDELHQLSWEVAVDGV